MLRNYKVIYRNHKGELSTTKMGANGELDLYKRFARLYADHVSYIVKVESMPAAQAPANVTVVEFRGGTENV